MRCRREARCVNRAFSTGPWSGGPSSCRRTPRRVGSAYQPGAYRRAMGPTCQRWEDSSSLTFKGGGANVARPQDESRPSLSLSQERALSDSFRVDPPHDRAPVRLVDDDRERVRNDRLHSKNDPIEPDEHFRAGETLKPGLVDWLTDH